MKAFVAYRHTGEKTEYLEELLGTIREALRAAGVDAYCNFFDEEDFQNSWFDSNHPHQMIELS